MAGRSLRALTRQVRNQGFGSTRFRSAFGNLPGTPDKAAYQEAVVKIMEDAEYVKEWSTKPVCTILNGEPLTAGEVVATTDAFAVENGKMIHGDAAVLEKLKAAVQDINAKANAEKADFRKAARAIEDRFTSLEYGPTLIANQALDFKKQDGFTEIEEWVQAATVERRLNDQLLEDEQNGVLDVTRNAAFIGCVSNFSNFLDLSRKVLRNIELGVPVVVLSRSNTTQHMFRWFIILKDLMAEHNIPAYMATYAALDVAGQRALLASSQNSPMYFTGSREVAEKLKEVSPHLMAATVGPNTMVNTEMNASTAAAVRISSTIENAGQCTHVRHVVAPNVTLDDCKMIYDGTNMVDSPLSAIKDGFRPDGMIKGHPTTAGEDTAYATHESVPASYRISTDLPPDTIEEKWRQGFIDVTSVESQDQLKSETFLSKLAAWLVRNGPITLAVNGSDNIARYLFDRTSMTVYTIGTLDKPALTVSARPQEYEAFGEFPARPTLSRFTKFPVLVPSATPMYHSQYAEAHLEKLGSGEGFPEDSVLGKLWAAATNNHTRGYLRLMHSFLADACGPKSNTEHAHQRAAVAGWQRPPLSDSPSVLRVDKTTSVDALCVYLLPYLATNAQDCLYVSCDPENEACSALLAELSTDIPVIVTESDCFNLPDDVVPYNVQVPSYNGIPTSGGAPLVGPFLSLLFPVGHIKCLNKNDEAFVARWKESDKWLSVKSC